MNMEETKLLNPPLTNNKEENATSQADKSNLQKRSKIGFAAGGFAAGAMAGATISAYATTEDSPEIDENITPTTQEAVQNTPQPEEVLLATDEGIRVAQVNDESSFNEAFADARSQVGPGGVFEWRGHIYGTYYEEEWNNMDAGERAQFQSKVDYEAIGGLTEESGHDSLASVDEPQKEIIASNAEMVDGTSENSDVKVLGVEAVTDAQGNPITIAGIEVNGQQALLVDIDNDNTMDVFVADTNGDGQISENELYDCSDANISVEDLQQHIAMQQDPHSLLACNDGMPDYINNADVNSLA